MKTSPIHDFIIAVRRRLNRGSAWLQAARCLLATAAVCVVWALAWRIFGYAAPLAGYAAVVVLGLVAWLASAAVSRRTPAEAAMVADENFGLKDGLLSWLGFRGKRGEAEAYELHERAMAARVSSLDPAAVPVPRPRRMWLAGVALAAAAVWLSLLPHGAAVRARLAAEEITLERSAEVKRQLEEVVEELISTLDEEERGVLDPEALRELAEALDETKDQREAELQLARFEQELAKAMQGLEARQDEAVLKLAAEELAKSSIADVRQLGKELDAKDFQKAREELADMKPGAKPKLTPEEIEKLRKNAAKARDMAKRMADGARKRNFGPPRPGDRNDAMPLQDMLADLDADARELDGMLAEGEFDPDAEAMAARLDGKIDKLGNRFARLNARQKARQKLDALRQCLCDARDFGNGQCQSLGLAQAFGQQAGGLRPGTGSVESRRDARDELADNGNRAKLDGQMNGDGPSTTSVESADSGTGISGRTATDRQRDFQRQMESLVRRDDIPEELKLGVREYFERIHAIE